MNAVFDHFPELKIHRKELFTLSNSNRKIQQKIIRVFHRVNCKTFTFEEIGNPTVPGATVIFELGIADAKSFSFIDQEEEKKVLNALRSETFRVMDFFCSIRYYKNYESIKKPLKFDYYMLRFIFPQEKFLEVQIFHERGPRYITPDALIVFLSASINEKITRKILKRTESQDNTN